MSYNYMTAEEVAAHIKDGYTVGLSGFTPAGTPKAVTLALAKQAEEEHQAGKPF